MYVVVAFDLLLTGPPNHSLSHVLVLDIRVANQPKNFANSYHFCRPCFCYQLGYVANVGLFYLFFTREK